MASVTAAPKKAPSVASTTARSQSSTGRPHQYSSDGFRNKTERGALITSSLPTLQNLIKRSPDSYAEEFTVQWARFGSLVKIFQLGLGGSKGDEESLREVTHFVCQVSFFSPLSLYLCENELMAMLNRWPIFILL